MRTRVRRLPSNLQASRPATHSAAQQENRTVQHSRKTVPQTGKAKSILEPKLSSDLHSNRGKVKSNLEPWLLSDLHSCSCGACLYLRSHFIRPTQYTHLLKRPRSSWAERLVQAQPKIHETLSQKKEKKEEEKERKRRDQSVVNAYLHICVHVCICVYVYIHKYNHCLYQPSS